MVSSKYNTLSKYAYYLVSFLYCLHYSYINGGLYKPSKEFSSYVKWFIRSLLSSIPLKDMSKLT